MLKAAMYLTKIHKKLHGESGVWLNHSSLDDPKCFNVPRYLDTSTELTKYFVFSCHLIIKPAPKEDLKLF